MPHQLVLGAKEFRYFVIKIKGYLKSVEVFETGGPQTLSAPGPIATT
jgi:hypothetical protein